MFSWLTWSKKETPDSDATLNNTATTTDESLAHQPPNLMPGFQMYRLFLSEVRKKDLEKTNALYAKVNQAMAEELQSFEKLFTDWQDEIKKQSTVTPGAFLTDNDSQLIESFQTLTKDFRVNLTNFFMMLTTFTAKIVEVENKNTLSYTLVNQFEQNRHEETLRKSWLQMASGLQNATFDERNSLLISLLHFSLQTLNTVLQQLQTLKIVFDDFFQKLLDPTALVPQLNQTEEFEKWVIRPLGLMLQEIKNMQSDIQQRYHSPFNASQKESASTVQNDNDSVPSAFNNRG